MKNIHILPTDKPSRLFYNVGGALLFTNYENHNGVNIYITSDEKLKDFRPHKGKWHLEKGNILNKFPDYLTDLSECKLVIMTTDQDLIKDGVQPIDDEFLEWLVKNPSCNSVEVIYEPNNYFDLKQGWEHLLIIPKEKPKQETLKYVAMTYWEAAIYNDKDAFKNGFIEGAKWQKEQDKNKYSEEEVEKISKDAYIIGRNNILIGGFNKWVEQFKNK